MGFGRVETLKKDMNARLSASARALVVLAACAGACTGSPVPVSPPASAPYAGQRMVIAHPRGEADVHAIWELAEHVLEPHAPDLAAHRLLVTPSALEQLRDSGVPVFVEPMDVERWIERLAQPLEQVAAGTLEDQGRYRWARSSRRCRTWRPSSRN